MEAGKYSGNIVRSKVDITRNGCTQFVAVLCLNRYEGVDLQEPYGITAYLSLTKNDGSKNQTQIDSLCAALGWDGVSLKKLNGTDWSKLQIEAILDWDEYNGVRRLRVSWINAVGSMPNLRPVSPDVLDELEAEWNGAKRAVPTPVSNAVATRQSAATAGIPEDSIPF